MTRFPHGLLFLHLNVALLLGAVLEERVHEPWLDEVCCIELVENEADLGVVEVVLQPPEDGEAGDEDGVAEVALLGVLAQLDEAVDAVETDDLHADLGIVAQPGNWER